MKPEQIRFSCFLFLLGVCLSTVANGEKKSSTSGRSLSHCKPNEYVYFTCRARVGHEIFSLCGKPSDDDAESSNVRMQFRSGVGGNINFAYPLNLDVSAESAFFGEQLKPYGEGFQHTAIGFDFKNVRRWISVYDDGDVSATISRVSDGKVINTACAPTTILNSMSGIASGLPSFP